MRRIRISSVPPPGGTAELDAVRAELAETKAELAETKTELARLRGALEALQQPYLASPASDRTSEHATLQNVVVTASSGAREFEVEFVQDTHFTAGISSDMSEGGLFVATYHNLPVGSAVHVAFDLPSGHRVESRGEVRWARETEIGESRPGIGIAFTELSGTSLAHVIDFCREKPPLCFEV